MNSTLFTFPTGSSVNLDSIGKIFDVIWSNLSTTILESTLEREDVNWNVDDINLFLSSMLVMGLTPQPSIEDYFKQDQMGIFGSKWMQKRFTEHKWSYMHSHLHFEPKQCIDILHSNSQNAWNLNQVLVVDEMIVPFTGRWKWIQYVKGKPHNTGLKIYCLADSNYYLWDFWLYEGTDSLQSSKPDDIVLDFVHKSLKDGHKPHIIVADSYYGSLKLAEEIHKLKLGCLFSCKSDRPNKLFSDYLHKNLHKEEFSSIQNSSISAMTYYDKAKVNLITNIFNTNKTISNSENTKKLPLGIYWYRKWLGGVDHFDRWLHLYLTQHRNIKWTQALLAALLKIALNNTHILAIDSGIATDLKNTTLEVINHLSGSHTLRNDSNRPVYMKKTTGWGHFPKELDKSKNCANCKSNKSKSKTTFMCAICEVPLHPKCWIEYHEK